MGKRHETLEKTKMLVEFLAFLFFERLKKKVPVYKFI